MEKLNEVKQALKYLEIDAKSYADNFSTSMIVSTKNILAIAEAFRDLELLKEQYLNNWAKAEKKSSSLEVTCDELEHRAEAAEAKLAELEKQDDNSVAWIETSKNGFEKGQKIINYYSENIQNLAEGSKLFTHPAPAVDLAELVPDRKSVPESGSSFDSVTHWCDGFNSCRAAILRNTEEAK